MEFTERDELLDSRRRDPYTYRRKLKLCGYSINLSRSWVPVLTTVCVISAICIYIGVTVSSPRTSKASNLQSSNYGGLLGQNAPGSETQTESDGINPDEETTTRRSSIFDFFSGRRSRAPSVRTSLGRLQGVTLTSRGGREYSGFYNVPYAEPPVGELRFQPPLPVKAWNGTRDATVKGTMCVQRSRYNPDVDVEGTEDCLHVNVFTPRIPRLFRRTRYPVIVYFFGGGFMHGTANDFNADYFMDEDVVLVIVESRVGALGFLNTGLEARGNMGLKDQVEALKWVKANIADFGGDAEKVVAFGSSSGGICSHAHLLSPMSKGLMSGVISFSGATTMLISGTENAFDLHPLERAMELGIALNCTDIGNTTALVNCLKEAPYEVIAMNQPDFTPSIETIPENGDMSNVFFAESPLEIVLSGKANNVPWLVGVNSAEAILQSYTLLLEEDAVLEMNNNFDFFMKNLLGLHDEENETEVTEILDKIREFYFGNETIDGNSTTRYNLTNLISDRFYYHPIKVAGLAHAAQSNVYWYYLTKEANVSYADSVLPYFEPPYGVSHADEVQYVFFRPRYSYIPLDSEWAEFSKMFVKFLVSFADTGAPVNPDANGVEWPKVDPADNGSIWYNLDDVPKLIEPFGDRLELWDSFPFQLLYNSTSNMESAMQQVIIDDDQPNEL